tara:strand:+ start:260 stop:463 length:204 start_codon:yes stop_codon:yes gene_type:complete
MRVGANYQAIPVLPPVVDSSLWGISYQVPDFHIIATDSITANAITRIGNITAIIISIIAILSSSFTD